MPRLAISLFGPFRVTLDGAPVTELKTNKVQALLAYLAVEADRAHERASLTGLLWPEPVKDRLQPTFRDSRAELLAARSASAASGWWVACWRWVSCVSGCQGATCSTILPRMCRPSIISWALAISSSGRTAETWGLICPESTNAATSVKTFPMGGDEKTIA